MNRDVLFVAIINGTSLEIASVWLLVFFYHQCHQPSELLTFVMHVYGLVYLRALITVLKADLPEALNSVTEKVCYSKRINSPNIGRGSSWYKLNRKITDKSVF